MLASDHPQDKGITGSVVGMWDSSGYRVLYKRGESREKTPRRLEGAKICARLSSPCNVGRLLGFSFFAKSCRCRDDAFGFWCDKQYGCKNCQPWFYLRLEAYSFFWLSEGAYS
jgi:hypothetical protein